MNVLAFYFGWPLGAVWSNLIASVICAGIVWWRVRARMITHHLEQMAQRERHHEELKAHVTAAVAAIPRPAARQPKKLVTKPDLDQGAPGEVPPASPAAPRYPPGPASRRARA